jgi:hypothetical protein
LVVSNKENLIISQIFLYYCSRSTKGTLACFYGQPTMITRPIGQGKCPSKCQTGIHTKVLETKVYQEKGVKHLVTIISMFNLHSDRGAGCGKILIIL